VEDTEQPKKQGEWQKRMKGLQRQQTYCNFNVLDRRLFLFIDCAIREAVTN
jgi:hypothetical protein